MAMDTYKVKVQFIISGEYEITANSEQEAREKVKRFCGITAGYNVFCTLPEEVKHRFSNYPTKEIVSVTPKSK